MQYQNPQLNPQPAQPTNQLLNTQPASQMHPDKAMASLAFSTHLMGQLLQHHSPGVPQGENTEQQPQEQQTQESETPQEQSTEPNEEPDLSGQIDELETIHKQEITELKLEIANGKSKENEAKLKELEAKHKLDIETLKNQVKDILNG